MKWSASNQTSCSVPVHIQNLWFFNICWMEVQVLFLIYKFTRIGREDLGLVAFPLPYNLVVTFFRRGKENQMLCPIMHQYFETSEMISKVWIGYQGLICGCYHTRSVNLLNDVGSFIVSFIFIEIWLYSVVYETSY